MSLEEIIASCTVDAARAVGWQDRIGSLEVGREADIAVLQVVDGPVTLRDSVGAENFTNSALPPSGRCARAKSFKGGDEIGVGSEISRIERKGRKVRISV